MSGEQCNQVIQFETAHGGNDGFEIPGEVIMLWKRLENEKAEKVGRE